MPTRRTRWLLRPLDGGAVEVRRNNKRVTVVPDADQAQQVVREQQNSGDRVYEEQDDGYRLDVTRNVGKPKRKHWRR